MNAALPNQPLGVAAHKDPGTAGRRHECTGAAVGELGRGSASSGQRRWFGQSRDRRPMLDPRALAAGDLLAGPLDGSDTRVRLSIGTWHLTEGSS